MYLIQKWLAGKKNYYVGAVLYDHFGTDNKLKLLFSGHPNKYKQDRLEAELSALLKKPGAVLVNRIHSKDKYEMPQTSDPVLEALRKEWNIPYQRMQYLRHELDRFDGNSRKSVASRHPIAKEILDLEQLCMVIWSRRDYYLEHGTLPEVEKDQDPLPADPIELGKLIESTKRNIRRNKKLMTEHPTNAIYPLKLKHYQAQLDRIMKSINNEKTGE